jgi:glutathione S-transferase
MPIPPLPALVTLVAMVGFLATVMLVGAARVKHGVKPPSVVGPEPFERALRVQQNTLEQLMVFLPCFWLAVAFSSEPVATALGFVWVGGRVAFAVGYLQAAEKRAASFAISFTSSIVLLVMALVGVLARLG